MSQPGPGEGPPNVGAVASSPSADAPRAPRRWRRRLGVLALLAGAVLGVVHLAPVRERVRRYAIVAARDRFDTVLTIGQLDYNLLTLSVTVRDVSAAATRSPGAPFFRAEAVSVQFRPETLVGRVGFSSIDLARPRLAFVRDEDGRYRLPSINRRGVAARPTPTIQIDRLSITGLDLQVEGAPPMTFEARDVSASLAPERNRIRGRLLAINGTRFRSPAGTVVDVGVDGAIGLSPESVVIGPLTVTMAGSRVEVEGKLPFAPGPPRLDLAYRASVSLADAGRVWPALGSARGQVTAGGTLAGPLSALALTFDATTRSIEVRGIAVTGATAKGSVGHGAVTLASATVDVAGGRVTGTASFGLGENPTEAAVQWRGVGLNGLLKTLDVPFPFPLAASLDGKATCAWDDRGLGSVRVGAEVRATRAAAPRGLSLAGRASLTVTGARWVLDLDHQLGGATAIRGRLSGVVNGERVGASSVLGRLAGSIAAADVARTVALMPAAPASVEAVAARLHGDASATFDVSGRLGTPVFAMILEGGQIQVDGFGNGRLHAEARLDRRGATFDTLSAALAGTTVRARGELPFDGRLADLEFTGEVGDVAAWLGEVPERWRPSGRLAVNGTVSGRLSDLRVDGVASSGSVAWPFWKPGAIDVEIHVADSRLQFSARVPSVNGSMRGTLAISSPMDLDLAARVDGADLQRLGDIAAGLGAPRAAWKGAATLSARVTGVVDGEQPVSVDIGAESLAGEADGRPVGLVQPARVVVSSARVSIEGVRLTFGRSTITAAGSLPAAAGEPRLHVEADGEVGEWWPAATGRVRATFEATGLPTDPALEGEATLSAATFAFEGVPPVTGINARVRMANETIELVEARGTWSGGAITAQGQMPLSFLAWSGGVLRDHTNVFRNRQSGGHLPTTLSTTLSLRTAITGLTQAALEPWIGHAAVAEISGQASAQLDVQGSALALDALRGTAVITQSDTVLSGLTVRQPKPARLKIDNGRITVEDAAWAVGNRTLTVSGGVDVRGTHPRVDLGLAGDVDLALARAFVPLALSGTAAIDTRVSGEADRLSFSGGATLSNAGLGIAKPRVAISGVSGRLTLEKDRLVVAAQGSMNGGTVELSGALPLRLPTPGTPPPADALRVRGAGFLLEWPEGLRSTVDGDVTYRIDANGGLITGVVTAEPGAYRRAAPPTFSSPAGTVSGRAPAPPSFFDATRLDVAIVTRAPGLVDNSYARVEVEADLHVGGSVGEPAVGGRLSVREEGEVYLRGNVFRIERGRLEFNPDPKGRTSVNLLAHTRRSGYDIRLRMTGPTDDVHVILTSDPPLAQPDLMALITTGSTSNSMSPGAHSGGSSQNMLVAAISSDILGLAGKTVGLDSVRVGELDLDLMGDDVDPQTRLTIGKSISSWLELLLSQNLRESGFTWAVTVHPFGSVQVRFVSKDSETRSVQVAHEVVFGRRGAPVDAPPKPTVERVSQRVTAVSVSGGGLSEHEVLDVTKVKVGDDFDFFEWQRDRERIESLFHEHGHLQVQVSAAREPGATGTNGIALRYQVRRGPLTTLRVTGFTLPETVIEGMKTAWSASVDDRFLREDLQERVRFAMIDLGYLRSGVAVEISSTTEPREKSVEVKIEPGPRTTDRRLVFEGRRALAERELREELLRAGAGLNAWRDPAAAAAALEVYYGQHGFLDAKVAALPIVLDGSVARLPLTIDEGVRCVVSRIDIRGASGIAPTRVASWLQWRVGDAYNPADREAAAKRVESGYVADGYRGVRAAVTATREPGHANVAVAVDVQPGARSVVGEVHVTGGGGTREAILRRAIDMPVGSAASPTAADRAQRRLYETEAFRSVDIRMDPMTGPASVTAGPAALAGQAPQPAGAPAAPALAAPTPDQATRVVVALQEAPLYRFRYGFQVTEDLTPATEINDWRVGVSAELRRRNLFGTALGAGIGGRYEVGNYSARAALNIPTSMFWPALSTLYFKQSLSTDQAAAGVVETVETSLTYQERWRLGQKSELSYGYAFTREELQYGSAVDLGSAAGGPTHRADLYAALAWDKRDTAFNASKGWFHSSSLEYGAPAIASDFSYLRYLFQQSYYRQVGPVVLAGALRTGVLVGVTGDDNQTYSLRFRTGGDRTVRGYALDSLTAAGESGAMVGGRGLLVVNGEARFPVWRWLKGAAFLDAGNAFDTPAHISFGDLKVGTGVGLRLDTPYALFRFDVGFPYPQPSSKLTGRFYFSIGQAF